MLWPPDGLNLKQGTSGDLFGYGYLPLPLTPAKKTTVGKDVPAETGLATVTFPRRSTAKPQPYVTPDEADSCWKKPGPATGPFEAKLGDGSVVTYY